MKTNKWLFYFLIGALFAGVALFTINIVVDPFGVFGDPILDDYAYNMTNNPRVAKIAYLDKNYTNYNGYIVGGSKSSSLSPEKLNEKLPGMKFYNMMMYGGDFYDYEVTIRYIVENYQAKHIVLHMSMQEIDHYNKAERNLSTELSGKVLSDNETQYFIKYLTMNLKHSFQKLESLFQRRFDASAYGVFLPESGVYNKTVRDNESLGSLNEFLNQYPAFKEPLWNAKGSHIDENVDALSRIKTFLDEKNITFTFVVAPTYHREMDRYSPEDIEALWTKLVSVTSFWDFAGYPALSYDARNFYDSMHYRNHVGNWMIERMFGDGSKVPSDFGSYATSANIENRINALNLGRFKTYGEEKVHVPILMYHHLVEQVDDSDNLSASRFEEDLMLLKSQGYSTIVYKDLIDFVTLGKALPEKPLIITFDDGYLSNYELAYPLLKKYNMKAVISMIGWSVGRDTFRDSDVPITPHFSWEQALEMQNSGCIELQCHSYDMHELMTEGKDYRKGVLQKSDESFIAYVDAFESDVMTFNALMENALGQRPTAFTYPYGLHDPLTEGLLKRNGFSVTVTTVHGTNWITQDSASLYGLKRVNVTKDLFGTALIEQLTSEK